MRICHTHNGPYEASREREGCQNPGCIELRAEYAHSNMPYFTPVGMSDSDRNRRSLHERKFNRDMDVYREARRAGMQPEKVSEKAVKETLWKQGRDERLIEKGYIDG